MTGGEIRHQSGFVDALVSDSLQEVRQCLLSLLEQGVPAQHRSARYDHYLRILSGFDTAQQASSEITRTLFRREEDL